MLGGARESKERSNPDSRYHCMDGVITICS